MRLSCQSIRVGAVGASWDRGRAARQSARSRGPSGALQVDDAIGAGYEVASFRSNGGDRRQTPAAAFISPASSS